MWGQAGMSKHRTSVYAAGGQAGRAVRGPGRGTVAPGAEQTWIGIREGDLILCRPRFSELGWFPCEDS